MVRIGFVLILYVFIILASLNAQNNVGIGVSSPDPSAMLHVNSSNQGLLIPRLNDTNSVVSPADALLIYWSSKKSFWFFNGNSWKELGSGGSSSNPTDGWALQGNSGTSSSSNFIGTTDNVNLMLKTNNIARFRINNSTLEVLNSGGSVFIGEKAGINDDTTDNKNIYIGYEAGTDNSTGRDNVGIGYQALRSASSSSNNVALGNLSLTVNTSGRRNVALGFASMLSNTTGNENVAVGQWAMSENLTGLQNVAIGYSAGYNSFGNNNVYIGYQAGYNETGSNKLYIESSNSSDPLIFGDFNTNQVAINWNTATIMNQALNVNGDAYKSSGGNMWATSDLRLKKEIKQLSSGEVLEKMKQLNGVTYTWNDTITQLWRPSGLQYGFTAQNLQEVFPELVQEDNNGFLMTQYGSMDPMIIEAIKELATQIDHLQRENLDLKARIESLEKR